MPPRKPAICLAVILPLLIGGSLLVFWLLLSAYSTAHGVPISAISGAEALLLAMPGFVFWVPLCLLISNGILYAVSPLRSIAQRHVASTGRPDSRQSQGQLLTLSMIAAAVCLPLIASVLVFGH
jgi:disulfide bond formation protein DsbB